jgi:hypothetical protein
MTQWARTQSGDMLLPTMGEGASALVTDIGTCAVIKIKAGLQFILGEWFLDQTLGFPWLPIWQQRNPDVTSIRQQIRKFVLGVPTVVEVVDLSVAYNAPLRDLQYALSARLSNGQIVSVP